MGCTACTEPQCLYSTAIPLLPLWAVRPVQSLSVCTVELYLYSPYGLYSLYRASVPVQYSYTSTSPMCRTPCTEPQCLYSRAIPILPLWAVQSFSACIRVHFTLLFHLCSVFYASKKFCILLQINLPNFLWFLRLCYTAFVLLVIAQFLETKQTFYSENEFCCLWWFHQS